MPSSRFAIPILSPSLGRLVVDLGSVKQNDSASARDPLPENFFLLARRTSPGALRSSSVKGGRASVDLGRMQQRDSAVVRTRRTPNLRLTTEFAVLVA
ncbi:hypothetical protein TNCT_23501 [Trichonephila clavata]|uniref:Uncharacterized protein n=1 Tax=Trichonephila clavata TaxID=2740835 RepID=A0A8X6K7W2_TRICU|nr:hypothetical protein TNCT_23501 [Trichonephila clavata]